MGQTLTEKILSRAVGRRVSTGEVVWVKPDLILMHDLNSLRYFREMEPLGWKIRHPDDVALMIDHQVPSSTVAIARNQQYLLKQAEGYGIKQIFRLGDHGISHQLAADRAIAKPGMLVMESDTHASTLGGVGALAIAISFSIPTALVYGKSWVRVPESIRVNLHGKISKGVMARDIGISLLRLIGPYNGDYRVIEFAGGEGLSRDQRMTLTNLTVEIGAKSAIFPTPPDEITSDAMSMDLVPDVDANYALTYDVDLGSIEPVVAVPPSPDCSTPISAVRGRKLDQVYIGSCAGGRMEDMRTTAAIFAKGRVNERVRCYVVPSTVDIYRQATDEGLLKIMADAGAIVMQPTCGPCFGQSAFLADGEVCISTSTRNEPGRMGSKQAEIYLASTATCAASAIRGQIEDPRELLD